MNNRSVLVLGSNNQYTLGLVRCLGEWGEVEIHCALFNFKSGNSFLSRYPKTCKYVRTPEEGISYFIKNFKGKEMGPSPIIISANDCAAAAIDLRLKELTPWFICATVNGRGGLVQLMDKEDQRKRALLCGFQLPWSVVMHKSDPLPSDLRFPVFTKSTRSIDGGKCDEFVCNDAEELKTAIQQIHAGSFFISEYIEKKYELNYFGIATKNQVYIPIYDEVHRFSKGGYGGYQNFIACEQDDFVMKIKRMIKDSGYCDGLFSVEFLVDRKGVRYFMEVNFRHDGATYRMMPALNFPKVLCQVLWGDIDEPLNLKLKKRKFFGINETKDFIQAVKENHIGIFKWIVDFLRADSRVLVNFKDPVPFIHSLGGVTFRQIKEIYKHLNGKR